ncbi:MAG TPA: ketoacyl-ACP synthase III [Nitrospirales bacterium]|nr:3-oxoacyl-ACP synthase [Nitrospiraceae bacterium]HNP28122.1 ketoacyl-ACP synthase III [Nitrospirales bacterium]
MNGNLSRIVGTGSFLPVRRVENQEVADFLGIEPSYIFRVSGIRTRFWADSQEGCSLLAEQASRRALDQAGLVPEDLDAILVSSTSPEMIFPSTACLLQARMGIKGIPAFDLSASCSGFLYGLSMADCLIRAGQFRRCLVVASEIKSRSLDVKDLSTAILFGDGAGAAIVERSSDSEVGIVSIRLQADGAYHDLVKIAGGGSRQPLTQTVLDSHEHTLRIQGSQLFRIAIRCLGQAVIDHLEQEKWAVSQLDQVIFHQANGRMLAKFCQKLGIPPDRCFTMIEEVGNTSSASLPMALDRANRDRRLKKGDRIMLGAFGGGLTWGTALVHWG